MKTRATFILALLFSQMLMAAPMKLALNWKAEPQFGGFFTAAESGLFKNAGLDVQVLEGGSGTPTVQMLAAGQVEYAVVSADEVILAHDRGASDVVAIFATFQINPQAIMTHEESGYKKLEDLLADSKATLLWQAGIPYAQFLKKKTKNFQVKTAPYSGGISNFQHSPQMAQQCFITSEPLAAKRAGLKTRTFLVADSGYNPYTTVLVTKASRLKEKPEEVKKIVAAVREGWNQYLKNPSSTNNFMQKINKAMDPETFGQSAQAQLDLIQNKDTQAHGLGSMTEERWKTLVDQLHDLKLIKTKPAATKLFQNP